MTAMQLLHLARQLFLEGLWCVRGADALGAVLGEEAELGRAEAHRPPRLGRQGYPCQLGLLHAQERPVRRVLAVLPAGLDGIYCRRSCAFVELPGRS